MKMCTLLSAVAIAASLTTGVFAQEDHVYTNSDVPTYHPHKKASPSGKANVSKPVAKTKGSVKDKEEEKAPLASSVGRRPLEAGADPAFSAFRAQPVSSVGFQAPKLPGAKEVYAFEDSAFQRLPERVLRISSYDSNNQEWNVYHCRVSDIIADEARRNGLDPLIIEIIIGHESAFRVDATSPVGAGGLMQLMPETAASLGCSDVNDPSQNIAAGTRYFAEQYRRFGNLHLALAAYNAGPGAVLSCGGVPGYDETVNYVCAIAQEYESRRKKRA